MLRNGAYLAQAVQFAQAHQLHQGVPSRRCFKRSGYHRHGKSISQPLIEPGIARTAADYMYLFDADSCKPVDLLKHLTIAQYKAFHNAAGKRCRRCERALSTLKQIGIDGLRHILRSQETRIIGVNESGKGWNCIYSR